MRESDYPLYLDGAAPDEEEMEGEGLYDSDFEILFREFLYESDFWNLDRRLDLPIPGLWLNEIARGEFYTELPARRVTQEESSPPVEKPANEKPRPYGANRGSYAIGSGEEAGEGQPEKRKVEEAYFDFGSFQIPDFDFWPGQKELYR